MFLPCHKDDTAMYTELMIWDRVMSHKEVFQKIISDRDTKLNSALWKKLNSLFGKKLSFSTEYCPQNDEIEEIMINNLEEAIRRFCVYDLELKDSDGFTHDWCTLISALKLAHKKSINSSMGKNPQFWKKNQTQ
ncbi:hypothetical protein O181_008199 [Austropuccinia psidii MF-1]|uniref:Uncharacterized protein n=1 Tax=Austropuccinia psidii MF-1 TaxID=1389203 RepID=A0A9Q3BNF0_9BASI|nr:hypothetical protein [Austropuccinia psidii MF-1]